MNGINTNHTKSIEQIGYNDQVNVPNIAKMLDISISVAKGGDFRIPQGKPLEEWSEAELKYIIKNFLS